MDERTKQLIRAAVRVQNGMNKYYDDCPHIVDGHTQKCPCWHAFIRASIAFMKLDPPFPDHEFVQTTQSIADPNDRYFSDSTVNEFGASFDHYLNLIRNPAIVSPDNYNPHFLRIVNVTDPTKDSTTQSGMWIHAGITIDDGSDKWNVIGYRIDPDDPDDKLELICEPFAAYQQLIDLIRETDKEDE